MHAIMQLTFHHLTYRRQRILGLPPRDRNPPHSWQVETDELVRHFRPSALVAFGQLAALSTRGCTSHLQTRPPEQGRSHRWSRHQTDEHRQA